MNQITFDKEKYLKLKKEYDKAILNNKDIFIFEDHDIVVLYAKYLLEYLKPKFEKK